MRTSSKVVAAALAGLVWIAAALTIASQPMGAMAPSNAGGGSACSMAVLD